MTDLSAHPINPSGMYPTASFISQLALLFKALKVTKDGLKPFISIPYKGYPRGYFSPIKSILVKTNYKQSYRLHGRKFLLDHRVHMRFHWCQIHYLKPSFSKPLRTLGLHRSRQYQQVDRPIFSRYVIYTNAVIHQSL